ncbi:MAG: Ig-like domain-containing protein [Candidatus Schekmanbacteria bacterium]|nr:Ig-like domain-containing protein [Candidatus Schekmanbacteria bacterium]
MKNIFFIIILAANIVLLSASLQNAGWWGDEEITLEKASLNDGTTLLVSPNPDNNRNVLVNSTIKLEFSRKITDTTVSIITNQPNKTLFILTKALTKAGGAVVPVTVTANKSPVTVKPISDLEPQTKYILTVKAGITSNNRAYWTKTDIVIAFTTKSQKAEQHK